MWQAIKETLPKQLKNSDINQTSPIYDDNCELHTEKVTIASILNKCFISVGKRFRNCLLIHKRFGQRVVTINISGEASGHACHAGHE